MFSSSYSALGVSRSDTRSRGSQTSVGTHNRLNKWRKESERGELKNVIDVFQFRFGTHRGLNLSFVRIVTVDQKTGAFHPETPEPEVKGAPTTRVSSSRESAEEENIGNANDRAEKTDWPTSNRWRYPLYRDEGCITAFQSITTPSAGEGGRGKTNSLVQPRPSIDNRLLGLRPSTLAGLSSATKVRRVNSRELADEGRGSRRKEASERASEPNDREKTAASSCLTSRSGVRDVTDIDTVNPVRGRQLRLN